MAGVRPEGWLRCCADNAECRGHAHYPAFVPNTLFLLWALFGLSVSFLHNLSQFHMQLFLVPYSSFVFYVSHSRT